MQKTIPGCVALAALAPRCVSCTRREVRWENEGTSIIGDVALAMGNYFFTTTEGEEVKVEYTFGIEQMDDGALKIVLHHSSIPFNPASS